MSSLRTFLIKGNLQSKGFRLVVRECTPQERATVELTRDAVTVVITALDDRQSITLTVGSPIIGDWNEVDAAQAAISFACEPSCHDNLDNREWSESYGEALGCGAFTHKLLGKELRDGD